VATAAARMEPTHSTCDAAGEVSIRVPSCWSHPLVCVSSMLVLLLVAMALLTQTTQSVFALCGLTISGLLAVSWAIFLLVLWSLACPCLRDEGIKPGLHRVTAPIQVDLLRVGNGAIGMSVSPGRKRKGDQRDLRTDVDVLKDAYGIDAVVTLLEDRELEVMCCEDMGEVVASKGMLWVHFPIRDKWIPTDTRAFLAKVVHFVAHLVHQGKRVLIHCNGGKGRTGTVVACVLMTSMALQDGRCKTLSEAVTRMRESRPGMLKNLLQQLYMHHLSRVLASI